MRSLLIIGTFLCFLAPLLFFSGCIEANQSYSRVAPGMWRGVLVLEKYQIPVRDKDTVILLTDQFKPGELPFNFEVKYTEQDKFYIEIINGTERIRCDSIQYGRDRSQARDTMNIYFTEYASYLHAEIRGGVIQGEWIITTKENYRIPFYAHAGRGHRFTTLNETPTADLSGEWAASFDVESEKPYKAIGEFKQNGNHLSGTFRTETGDYRFLEGTVQGRKFWLSCFDGSHAFLFSGSIKGDTLQGEFRSGKSKGELWQAWKDPNFKLGDANTLTSLKAKAAPITFAVTNPEGRKLVFPGPDFGNKVKIFTIMGTWCPNCRDEQMFLKEYLEKHPEQAPNLAIVGFAFERHKDSVQANRHLLAYKQKMGIPFDIVHAGKNNKDEAAHFFPALEKVMAFPTMIILDQQNKVQYIHTGFDGPATSKYNAFSLQFEKMLQELLQKGG